jgi:hypothetical protein
VVGEGQSPLVSGPQSGESPMVWVSLKRSVGLEEMLRDEQTHFLISINYSLFITSFVWFFA